MSEENKNRVYYNREELTGLGPSKIEIFEIETPGKLNTENISGQVVTFKSVVTPNPIKSYVVIERYSNFDLTTLDIVYGNLNLEELKNNKSKKQELFEGILSRENIEIISRKYLGILPKEIRNGRELCFDMDEVKMLAGAIYSSGFLETRETSVKLNNDIFSKNKQPKITFNDLMGVPEEKRNKKRKFFDVLFGKDIEEDATEETFEISNDFCDIPDDTTYKKTDLVLFLKSGSVILNKKFLLKFIYATKDSETGERTASDSFLIENFDEERLKIDENYRKNFVNQVLTPSGLKNARTVKAFPYIGGFNDSGRVTFDVKIWEELNSIVRNLQTKIKGGLFLWRK